MRVGRTIIMGYKWFVVYMNMWRIVPVYILVRKSKFHEKIRVDNEVWAKKNPSNTGKSALTIFGYNMMTTKEFRNVILNRLHRNPFSYCIARFLFKPLESLYINMAPEKLGAGIYFQHGFATILAAKEVGEFCNINQQVTVGYNGEEAPVIGSKVTICAGAIVIGNVKIGDGATVGAGAVVTHDVPANTVVAGVPASIIRKKSEH